MISNLIVAEGDTGMTPFSATVSMNYTYGAGPLTVRITATPGTASDSDFVFATTEVVLTADGTPQSVSGFIVGDIEPENDEVFSLTATVVSDGGYPSYYFYSSGGSITIKDDDGARASRLHAEGATVLEGDHGNKQVEIRVALEPASTTDVKVNYRSQDGTAVAKLDYQPVSGTLYFAPGEVLKTIAVDIIGDTDLEPDETFSVMLSDPSMALLGTAPAEVVIANDDLASTPPDALPPVGTVEPQPDGGATGDRLDAGEDSKMVEDLRGTANGFDSTPVTASDTRIAGNDSGTLGGGATPSNDSGAPVGSTAFGGDCSCSLGAAGHGSAGILLVLGVGLAGWLRRRRR